MASLMQWLSEPVTSVSLSCNHLPENPTRLQVAAALIEMGGYFCSGYGVTTGGGPYGKHGLEQDEAFIWWEMRAFIEGVLYATHDAERAAFQSTVEAEWARVEALSGSEHKPRDP
jgi:hypothetical protein